MLREMFNQTKCNTWTRYNASFNFWFDVPRVPCEYFASGFAKQSAADKVHARPRAIQTITSISSNVRMLSITLPAVYCRQQNPFTRSRCEVTRRNGVRNVRARSTRRRPQSVFTTDGSRFQCEPRAFVCANNPFARARSPAEPVVERNLMLRQNHR